MERGIVLETKGSKCPLTARSGHSQGDYESSVDSDPPKEYLSSHFIVRVCAFAFVDLPNKESLYAMMVNH